ncbi:MAG: hypothetical protein ABSH53_24110 [Holophaga sp.]
MTFTYGPNGLDFAAAWADAKVQVALEAAEAVPPVPALDAGRPGPEPEDPSAAFRALEARLRIAYEGPEAPASGYTVSFLLCPEDLAPAEFFVDHRQPAFPGREAIPPAFTSLLQVVRVQAEDSEDRVEFTYGKAPAVTFAGTGGTLHCSPTVLQAIILPQQSLQLDWEAQSGPGTPEQTAGGPGLETSWSYGVKAIREKIPTLERDVAEQGLVPVSGAMTRRLDWEPGTERAPDLHRAGYRRTAMGGLMGGDPGVGGPGSWAEQQNQALAARLQAELKRSMEQQAAQAREAAARAMAEQQARQMAIRAQLAQAEIQRQQSAAHTKALMAANMAAIEAEQKKKQIEEHIRQAQAEVSQREGLLKQQEEEIRRQTEELKRQAQELEQQTQELIRQAEELKKQTPG